MSVRFRPENTKKVLVMFAELFNDVKALQKEKNKPDVDVNLPVFVESTNKLISRLNKTDSTRIYAPALGIMITSMDVDEDRMLPPIRKIFNKESGQYVFVPVPYNYTIDLAILCKRESQVFEILEEIVPFYRKARYYPLVHLKFNDGTAIQNDIPVELIATPTEIISTEIGGPDEQIYRATLSFLVRSWVYGYNSTLPDGGAKLINHIDIDFENMTGRKFERLHIEEDTGGDAIITITDPP